MEIVDPLIRRIVPYLRKTGDTMLGFLTLNADPVNDLHAVTKQYVDDQVASLVPALDWNAYHWVNGQDALSTDLGHVVGANRPWGDTTTGATVIPGNHIMYLMQHVQPVQRTISSFQINVTISGANSVCWFVIYRPGANGSLDRSPGSLYHCQRTATGGFTNMFGGAGVKTYTPSGGIILPAGFWWIGMATNHADPTVSTSTVTALSAQRQTIIGLTPSFTPVQHLEKVIVTGPSSDPFGTPTFSNGNVPMIRLTFSA